MKCINCKKIIDDEDMFCGYCGFNIFKFKQHINKLEQKVHKEKDREHEKNIKKMQKRIDVLKQSRKKEIERIAKYRWRTCETKDFRYNVVEGKIEINGKQFLFSDIKAAAVNKEDSYRIITRSTGSSRKHASLGGALAGGLISGSMGAVVGGSVLGKTKSSGMSYSNTIPTCNHIGVNVNIKGFISEIIILSNMVDQSSSLYKKALKSAQIVVDKLRDLSSYPVPKTYLKPEEEDTVLRYNSEIKEAKEELEKLLKTKPVYDIPEEYYMKRVKK